MTFHPGDIVRVIDGPRKGEVTEVIGPPEPRSKHSSWRGLGVPEGAPVYPLALE